MNSQLTPIYSYTITDICSTAGRPIVSDFHVYLKSELSYNARIINHPIQSDHYIISLVLSGECKVKCNLRDFFLRKNSLSFTAPHVIYVMNDPYKMTNIAVGFSKDFLDTLRVHEKQMIMFNFFAKDCNPHVCLTDDESERLHKLLQLLREKFMLPDDQPFKNDLIKHVFSFFILEIAAIFSKYHLFNVTLSKKEKILSSFLELLNQNFKKERTLNFYAGALHITPKHLTKITKELTNKTGGELIDEIIIIEAKILLRDLGLSIANVAGQLQFSDQFSFSKFFKKRTGINPSKYRENVGRLP